MRPVPAPIPCGDLWGGTAVTFPRRVSPLPFGRSDYAVGHRPGQAFPTPRAFRKRLPGTERTQRHKHQEQHPWNDHGLVHGL